MLQRRPQLVADLRKALEEECRVHSEYSEAIAAERELVKTLKTSESTERLAVLVARRDGLASAMQECQKRRLDMLSGCENATSRKLSDLITKDMHPADAAQLMPHVNKLKKFALKSKESSLECGQVVSFSLGLLNGLVSLFHNASQSVVRSYSRLGKIKESYHPTKGRSESLLKEV